MMRAWENRPDTVVVDEPFYAAYLARTGLDHPGRDEVIASQPTDAGRGGRRAARAAARRRQRALRQAHDPPPAPRRRPRLGRRLPQRAADPRPGRGGRVLRRSREACEPEDIGLLQQVRLLDAGCPAPTPPVIDAADFLRDPEAHLRWLCDWLGIPFTDRMLAWPAGPRDSDGVWAPYWYDAVRASTGFAPYRPREVDLSPHDAAVAEACRPAYDALHARRLVL